MRAILQVCRTALMLRDVRETSKPRTLSSSEICFFLHQICLKCPPISHQIQPGYSLNSLRIRNTFNMCGIGKSPTSTDSRGDDLGLRRLFIHKKRTRSDVKDVSTMQPIYPKLVPCLKRFFRFRSFKEGPEDDFVNKVSQIYCTIVCFSGCPHPVGNYSSTG